jgi:hypothetical protein
MEYGNGSGTMIEMDMVYVSYFGDLLRQPNILFRLSLPRISARPPKTCCQAAKTSQQAGWTAARPGCLGTLDKLFLGR